MNLLMPSTGRRVSLIRLLRRAARTRNIALRIIGTEINPHTASLYECDTSYILPRTGTDKHREELLRLLEKESIDCLLPGNDIDLKWLCETGDSWPCRILWSGEELCRPWLLKSTSHQKFLQAGLVAPEVYDPQECPEFPVVLKEDGGYGSVNQFYVGSQDELLFHLPKMKAPFIQKKTFGVEYTVDGFSNQEHEIIRLVPRIREAVRSGVSDVGRIDLREDLIELIRSASRTFRFIGPWNVQCFATEKGFEFIEVNPRFSGGIPLTEASGADFCGLLLDWALNREWTPPGPLRNGLRMMKYEQEFFV